MQFNQKDTELKNWGIYALLVTGIRFSDVFYTMRNLVLYSFLIIIGLSACKKGYTCACSNDAGYYDGVDIRGSKKQAEQKCNAYYMSKYDTARVSNVNCELKKGE